MAAVNSVNWPGVESQPACSTAARHGRSVEANRAGGDGDARVGIAVDATWQRAFGHLVLLRPRRWASALRKSCWQRSSNGEGSRNQAAEPYRVGTPISTLFSVCRDRTPPLRAPETPSMMSRFGWGETMMLTIAADLR